jgi:hypothetical protein
MLVKVNAVADKAYEEKYEVKQPALDVAKCNSQSMQRFDGN